jgi:hypothetical protein
VSRGVEFLSRVVNGRLAASVAKQIAAVLGNAEGKQVLVSIKEVKRTRSGAQNRLLWGYIYPPIVAVFREQGNAVDAEDVHLYCKQHVGKLKQVLVTPDGEVLHTIGSTTRLSTTEFSDYVEAVRAWAVEVLGIDISLLGEQQETHEGKRNDTIRTTGPRAPV